MAAIEYLQGDVVTLKYKVEMPDGKLLYHPVLIISSNISNSYEKYYTGVMLSATTSTDRYSIPCFDGMFESKLGKDFTNIRSYMIVSFRQVHVQGLKNRMKPIHFKNVLEQIKDNIFSI